MTTPVTSPEHVEVFAQTVLDYLVANERSFAWLARQTDRAANTLAYQLRNPSALSLETSLRIEAATGIKIDRVAA